MMGKERAFTRSDLVVLVVVFILLIWMGTLLGRGMAIHDDFHRNIKCQNNLKKLGLALNVYLNDNEQRFCDSYRWLYQESPTEAYYCRFHNKAANLVNHPEWAGSFYKYVAEPDLHICPTFDHLARSGLGAMHSRHVKSIPMEPQYTYSMNGYLGPGRFGQVKKLGQIGRNPSEVFSFSEENGMWNIQGRNAVSAVLNCNMITRLSPYEPENYNSAFATYHMAPSEEIELAQIDNANYAVQTGKEYPKWGLCRGSGNAVFLDQHVQAMPYHVDTHDYAWPLLKKNR